MVEMNIARWCGMFDVEGFPNPREAANVEQGTLHGLPVTHVEIAGTYVAETTPGSGERVNKADWVMIASILETPGGPHYFKLLGPAASVEAWRASYEAYLDALIAD
jgi:hypothetical protein